MFYERSTENDRRWYFLISLSLNDKIIFENVFSLKEKNVAILRSNDIAIVQYNKVSFSHVEEV